MVRPIGVEVSNFSVEDTNLLEQFPHIGKFQYGTTDAVKFANDNLCNQARLDVIRQFG